MSKYIDADLLKKGIEELEGLEYPCDNSEQNVGFEYALDRVSDIITSLQQEQPCDTCTNDKGCVTCTNGELWEGKEQPSEDLEKEIERFLESEESTSYTNAGGYVVAFKDTVKIARHFYELGKQSKEPISEDLEEEMDKFFETMPVLEHENIFEDTFKNIARHFAEWQKGQMPMPEDTVIFQKGIAEGKRLMMEEAVEAKGVICKLSDRVWISPVDEEKFHQEVYDRFVVGQTVKIIIVKEEE